LAHGFDPGYGSEPFRTLCGDYPDIALYPTADFRTEWGPVFHRGRLDGSARILVIGQDPAQHETIARRILVGEAGQRIQGFLAKLGITRSYLMINTFLYSVFGQGGGNRHKDDEGIIAYRNRWIEAALTTNDIEAVVALGTLAGHAWQVWKASPAGAQSDITFAQITHPTQPESSSGGDPAKHAAAILAMLQNWNAGLQVLQPALKHPDLHVDLTPYGTEFAADEIIEIPEADLPPGTPPWMRGVKNWAARTGKTPALKRVTITITIPTSFRP